MALIPSLFRDVFNPHPTDILRELYDQNFGCGLSGDELLTPSRSLLIEPFRAGYLRPWRFLIPARSGVSNVTRDDEGWKVSLDVQLFKPEELKVKIVDDFIVVEGKHEERSDEHGFVSRQFTRRYKLPKDIDPTAVISSLSSDGVLKLTAPKKSLPEAPTREIPIVHTNAPAVKEGEKMETK